MNITNEHIESAARRYTRVVTGPMAGCKHPAALLRWVLGKCTDEGCKRLAENYIKTGNGACWNAMCNSLPADGWLVWYAGDGK